MNVWIIIGRTDHHKIECFCVPGLPRGTLRKPLFSGLLGRPITLPPLGHLHNFVKDGRFLEHDIPNFPRQHSGFYENHR